MLLLAAGSNSNGQIGTGTTDDVSSFTPVRVSSDVHAPLCVSYGACHSILKLYDGSYVAAGRSLTDSSAQDRLRFQHDPLLDATELVACSWDKTYIVRRGVVTILEPDQPARTLDVGPIRSLHAGPRHALAITEDGRLLGWGAARHGQLGQHSSASIERPVTVSTDVDDAAAGKDHTVILSSGQVRCIGSNKRGQLGLDAQLPGPVLSVYATWSASFAVVKTQSYELWTWGSLGPLRTDAPTHARRVPLPEMLTPPVVACGSEHVLVLIDDAVWTFGWNEHGNLGLGHLRDTYDPVKLDLPGRPIGVAAGNATSWIAIVQ